MQLPFTFDFSKVGDVYHIPEDDIPEVKISALCKTGNGGKTIAELRLFVNTEHIDIVEFMLDTNFTTPSYHFGVDWHPSSIYLGVMKSLDPNITDELFHDKVEYDGLKRYNKMLPITLKGNPTKSLELLGDFKNICKWDGDIMFMDKLDLSKDILRQLCDKYKK